MMDHVRNMITSATSNVELSNVELADAHDETDGVLDCMAEMRAVVAEIAILTGEVEVDVASLYARGEKVKEHIIRATSFLGEAFRSPGVDSLGKQTVIASLRVKDVNETLAAVQGFMADRPEDYFGALESGLNYLTDSTRIVRQDLQAAQESNGHAIIGLKKYATEEL